MTCVLIVDDDATIREMLRETLEDEGYAVLEATDGVEGLARIRASQERLVVLIDQLMPKLDGWGMLRAIQADPHLARQHAYLLLTARSRLSKPLLEGAAALAVPIIRKPFELETLLLSVAHAAQVSRPEESDQ